MMFLLALLACDPQTDDGTTTEPTEEADPLAAPADVAAAPADAQSSESGLHWKVLSAGTGTEHPGAVDEVTVHYTGWMTDGSRFDSSVERGTPASFPLNGVIKGWTEGLQHMVVGEKTRFWIPADLAYGDTPSRPGGPFGELVFDVELISIQKAPEPPPTPEDVAGPGADATTQASGLAYRVLTAGDGAKPDPWDVVTIEFDVWFADGEFLDSSSLKGKPLTAPLNELMPGWSEGIGLMSVGEKTRMWVPPELATVGNRPPPPQVMVFDITLVAVVDQPEPPPVPKDVAAAPKDARSTASGLTYKTLQKGKGTRKPAATDTVSVHYSGWTPDGRMFDSSVTRGEPTEFPLNGVIKGWTEGLQLMTEGEKVRFWIPSELAYGDKPMRPGAPAGDLVFDVELLEIK